MSRGESTLELGMTSPRRSPWPLEDPFTRTTIVFRRMRSIDRIALRFRTCDPSVAPCRPGCVPIDERLRGR